MTILNDDARIVNKLDDSLTDEARVVNYDHHMFIVQTIDLVSDRCLIYKILTIRILFANVIRPTCPNTVDEKLTSNFENNHQVSLDIINFQ